MDLNCFHQSCAFLQYCQCIIHLRRNFVLEFYWRDGQYIIFTLRSNVTLCTIQFTNCSVFLHRRSCVFVLNLKCILLSVQGYNCSSLPLLIFIFSFLKIILCIHFPFLCHKLWARPLLEMETQVLKEEWKEETIQNHLGFTVGHYGQPLMYFVRLSEKAMPLSTLALGCL